MELLRTILFVLVLGVAWGYVLKPNELLTIGRASPGHRFWQPSKSVVIGDVGLVRISRSEDQCTESCKYSAALFNEEGEFKIFDYDLFCGGGGVLTTNSVVCHGEQVSSDETGIAVKRVEYSVGDFHLREEVLEENAFFNIPDMIPATLKVAHNVVYFPEKQVYVCSGELLLANSTILHAFFRSADGISWNMTSVVPFGFNREATIHRLGETKLMVVAGSPGAYMQATSVFLGSRWEKIENASYAVPLSTWVSPYHTTLYGGVRGRPGLHAMAAGPKKGSEKPIDIAQWHNRLATKQELNIANFSQEFKETTKFSCEDPFSSEDADGCASSSYVTMTSIGNGSVFFFYDKLENGFAPASEQQSSVVHAIKAHLNETKEENEHLAKLEEKKREAEKEKQREEARRQAQKEAEERKRRERREKVKQDKAKRAAFHEMDRVNFESAIPYTQLDGETVIVRDVDPDFVEIEKDTFFY